MMVKWFFLVLGVTFFLMLCALAYGWHAYDLGALFNARVVAPSTVPAAQDAPRDESPALNASQEAALRTVGIDPAVIPTASTITDEQKACLLAAVGEARAREIIAGAAPTFSEMLSAKDCL